LENELSGQDIKDKEESKKLDEELKQEWKKPTTWFGLVFAALITYGMYKIIMMLLK
jgi:hypothetical protein